MLIVIALLIIFIISYWICLTEDKTLSRIGIFVFVFICCSIIGVLIFNSIGESVFSDTNNQEMITTEETLISFIDSKDDPVYVKYSFKWNGGSTYKYVKQSEKYPEYKEISVKEDVNIVEGNYKPVLITHSYKANKTCDRLFGPTANWFIHDRWYEFYIPDGTFITY